MEFMHVPWSSLTTASLRLHGALGTSRHAAYVASILVVLLQIAVYLDELRALQTQLRVPLSPRLVYQDWHSPDGVQLDVPLESLEFLRTCFVALHGFAFAGVHAGCQFSALRQRGFFTGFKKIPRDIPHFPISQRLAEFR